MLTVKLLFGQVTGQIYRNLGNKVGMDDDDDEWMFS
jgi:hypothetical protein